MLRLIFLLIPFTLFPVVSWACASCGCTLSSDWEDPSQRPFKLDLRYDYINQNQLRSGSSTISPSAASQKLNSGSPQEVESYTRNNYLTASGEYSVDTAWRLALQVPYIFRSHATLGTASDGTTGGPGGGQYQSSTSSIGDVRLIGRYQGFTPQHNFGVLLGLKLPTGSFTKTGISTDPTAPGPVAIDRGLQPGSGTTDLISGLFYSESLNKNWDYFGEALYQAALYQRNLYAPGNGLNVNAGFRFFGFDFVIPQLQINARYVLHDQGLNADSISTGGTLVYLSPGVNVPVTSGLELYSFFQIPIYQYLLGVQLAPMYTYSVGTRYLF
jgi:hypothetical protein